MKRELKALSLITLVLAVLTAGLLLLQGGSLTVYQAYPQPISAGEITVETDEAFVKLVSVRVLFGNGAAVKLKRVGEGEGPLRIIGGASVKNMTLKSGPLGTLVNTNTRDFTGWVFLLLAGTLWFLAAFLLFYTGYRRERRENLYAYGTINKLGLSLLFGMLTLLGTVLLLIRGIDPFSFGFSTILNALSMAMVYFALFSAPAVFLFAVLLCVSNLVLIRRERFRPVNLLGIALSFLMGLGLVGGILLEELLGRLLPRSGGFWSVAAMNCYYGIYAFFVCMLFAVFLLFGYIRKHEPAPDKAFIVILGCRIRPDGTLYPLIRGRVDRALAFAERQEAAGGPAPIFIPSGGKGAGEPVAEAEAMAAYLRSRGIPEERILIEDRSGTTRENLRNSRALAEAADREGKAALSTSDYHVFRSGILAAGEGWRVEGMGSRTKWYFWPNAQIREFAGLLRENLRGIIAFFLVIALESLLVAGLW